MPVWLFQFPSEFVIAGTVAVWLAVCLVARYLLRVLFRLPASPDRHVAALDAFKVTGAIVGIFMAFLLVQSINRADAAKRLVETQATNLVQLDRALGRAPAAAAPAQALQAYARTVVSRGWPAMARTRSSPEVNAAFDALSDSIETTTKSGGLDAAASDQIFPKLEAVWDSQRAMEAAARGLPHIFWITILGLFALMLIELVLIDRDRNRFGPFLPHVAALAALLGLLIVMDRPFGGDLGAGAAPIERAILKLEHYRQQRSEVGKPG